MKIDNNEFEEENSHNGIGVALIDLQKNLLSGIHNKNDLMDSLSLFIKTINLFGLPHIITEQVPDKLGGTDPSIKALLSDYKAIPKNTFSIFGSESVELQLKKLNISHLILVGIESSICIYLSAIEALKRGYQVTILYDCLGARRKEDEQVALMKLKDSGCHIIPLESFIYGFMETSDHPCFREVSKLVRNRSVASNKLEG